MMMNVVLLLACRGGDKILDSGTQTVVQDADGDGFNEEEDCNDQDASIFPNAEEICDGMDNNCDGNADEEVLLLFYADADEDGYGNPDTSIEACDAPEGFVEDNTDCDDLKSNVYTGADEICDSIDNDCDGEIDEGLLEEYFADVDEDGFGDANVLVTACALEPGLSLIDGDCDDTNPVISPSEAELCDGIDNDCDGDIDEGVLLLFYTDFDGDGYGDDASQELGCTVPEEKVTLAGDCDDLEIYANPMMIELCDDIDNDCDGFVDEAGAFGEDIWYLDADGDGYGGSTTTQSSCAMPVGYSNNDLDCDDANPDVSPQAQEDCSTAYDDNCNGLNNESGALGEQTWYVDADEDSYGNANVFLVQCDAPTGFVSNSDDCYDLSHDASPVGAEICDGLDNDCNGTIDDAGAIGEVVWYADNDGDGFGVDTDTQTQCDQPVGYADNTDDCDDSDGAIHPMAAETCATLYDDNCNGFSNESGALGEQTWYLDADGDGYGISSELATQCEAPTDYVSLDGDCDDTETAINPDATEVCDTVDNDCDGDIDFDDSDITSECYDGINCLDIIQADSSAADGYYTIDPTGTGIGVDVYCNMTDNGGGWTLAVSISASNQNHYNAGAYDDDGDDIVTYATIGEKYDDVFIDALWTERIWIDIHSGSGDIHCERSNQPFGQGWSAFEEPICGYSFSSTMNSPNSSCSTCGPNVWENYDYRAYRNPYPGCNGASATVVPSGSGGCGYHPSRSGYLWVR